MVYVLAVSIGRLPAEIRAMPASDFIGLSALYELTPFGPGIDNWRSAQLAATVATTSYSNANQRQPKQYSVSDFLPNKPASEQSMEEQISLLKSVFPGDVM